MSVSHSRARVQMRASAPGRRRRPITRVALKPWLIRIAVVAVALVLGTFVVCKVLRPIRLVGNERRAKAKVVSDYNGLRKQNDELRRRVAYLKTPEGIAQEARKQGFVKPGEISLVIPEHSSPAKRGP